MAVCDGLSRASHGCTVWNVSNNVSKVYFELVLADFAKSVGAGAKKRIVLQLDNAGCHELRTLSCRTA